VAVPPDERRARCPVRALEEAGLRIIERVSIQVEEPEQAGAYLRTKKEKLGHLMEFL